VHEVAGTNYTIAGMVAGQCGVPLLPNGLLFQSELNSEIDSFMPSIHCLGDVLSEDGYTLSYMNGASADKFSKRVFYEEHGYTRIFDKNSLTDLQKRGRSNVWGINDALLFEHAYKEYDILKAKSEPFVLSLLSLSTHGPDAFLDTDCAPNVGATSQIPRAIQCTGLLVAGLIDYIKSQGDADNTVVVVQSDHLALFNSLRWQLGNAASSRRNLFMVLGAGAPSKTERPMTPFDYYPSILEGMGYTLKNGRANFGVAANSDTSNLMEELGKVTINNTFKANQNIAKFLWRENDDVPSIDHPPVELASN
jgi:phosphoglycerol transferase